MSNLKISYPDIPFNAAVMTTTIAEADDKSSIWNTINGPRYQRSTATSAGERYYTYDLGSNYASKYAGCDHVILARADICPLTQFYVEYSDNGSSWTSPLSDASITAAEIIGPRSQDYIQTCNNVSTPHRYWHISLWCASGAVSISKVYFGKFFDFTYHPAAVVQERKAPTASWYGDSGAAHMVRSDEPVYTFDVTWQGVTDAELLSFRQKILRYADINPVFLYTSDNHDLLDNQRLVHCRIKRADIARMGGVSDYYSLKVSFEELLG